MQNGQEKWLPNQLLDLFEKHKQIKNLQPVIIGYTKSKTPKFKKSPKFTPAIRMLLLAISKYSVCIMGYAKLANIIGLAKNKTMDTVKFCQANGLIRIEERMSICGDNDSNLYTLELSTIYSFFNVEVVTNRHHRSDKLSSQVVTNCHPIKKDRFNKDNNSASRDLRSKKDQKLQEIKQTAKFWEPGNPDYDRNH